MKNTLVTVGLYAASFEFTRDFSVAYVGVSFNLLFACGIGAYCSFSVGERVTPRGKMFSLFVACVFMGAAFTGATNAAIAHFAGMTMTDALQASVGVIVSFLTRFILPWLADVVAHGKWVDWIPFLNKRKDQ